MKSPMEQALGPAWAALPAALKLHYAGAASVDVGHLDIHYPRWMQPCLRVLGWLGALVDRGGQGVETIVRKHCLGDHHHWHRTMTYADGQVRRFNSVWIATPDGELIEFVNRMLGLQMRPFVRDGRLHYHGVRFVARLGRHLLPIPEWLVLGHTTIVEAALDDTHFAMDFRLTHPLFGEVFRYAGTFEARAAA